jgi:hypothetical protein
MGGGCIIHMKVRHFLSLDVICDTDDKKERILSLLAWRM